MDEVRDLLNRKEREIAELRKTLGRLEVEADTLRRTLVILQSDKMKSSGLREYDSFFKFFVFCFVCFYFLMQKLFHIMVGFRL